MLFRNSKKRTAFSIVELLTVMSIIVVLLSLLVPGLNQVRRYARDVKQKNQFHAIEVGLDLYNAEWGEYPDSEPNTATPYECGANRLADAMVGRDLLGYDPTEKYDTVTNSDLSDRRMYLPIENANAYEMDDIYVVADLDLADFDANDLVLCDVYKRVRNRDKNGPRKIGIPILYYKADTTNTAHNITADPLDPNNIYDYLDNQKIVELGIPQTSDSHKLNGNKLIFYEKTENTMFDKSKFPDGKPMRADSYLLYSAGNDGEYGTKDDVLNFER